MRSLRLFLSVAVLIGSLNPQSLYACACGCNVFDVGTSAMFPSHPGDMTFVEWDHQNQNRNWSGTSPSSADNNSDQKILTDFFTLGYEHQFNRKWGVMAELPYSNRFFKTTDDSGNVDGFEHSAVGDIRLKGLYTGISEDMSTGLIFGIKLPSGDYTYANFDPDTELGSGSTDLLLGGYQLGKFPGLKSWGWFLNSQLDLTVIHEAGYVPGSQVDAAAGAYYDNWAIGSVTIKPLAQLVETYRWRDGGTFGLSQDTGLERILLAPGLEFDIANFRIYSDEGFPVLQNVNGNQLVASQLYKLNVSYHF